MPNSTMKKLIIIIALLFVGIATMAQNHVTEKVNLTNSIWVEYRHFFVKAYCNLITTTEDTLLANGYHYLKLFSSSDTLVSKATFAGGIRFDSISNKIFINDAYTNGVGMILYDFNLAVGDTLSKSKGYYLLGVYDNSPNTPIRVMNIDTIQTNDGVSRKRFQIWTHHIIEGIGNVTHHFTKMLDYMLTGEIEEPTFSCYRQNSKCIIASNNCNSCFPFALGINNISKQPDNENYIYPNPVTNLLYIKPTQFPLIQLLVYNMNGQQVLTQSLDLFNQNIGIDVSALPKGIYTYEFTMSKNNTIRAKFIKQ